MKNWIINLAIGMFVKKIIRDGMKDRKVKDIGITIGTAITKQGTRIVGKNFNKIEDELQKKIPILVKGIRIGLDSDD